MFAHSYSEDSHKRAIVNNNALMYSSVFSWRRNDTAESSSLYGVVLVVRSTLTAQRLQSCVDRQAGPFSWGRPMALFIYIFIIWFCAASAECRASSDVAISAGQSVSQSVVYSQQQQSSRSSVARSSLVDCRFD